MKGWAWFYKIYLRHLSLLLFKTITGVDEELLLEGLDRVGIGDENLLKNLIIKDKVGLNSTSALLLYSILPYRLPSKLYGRSKGNWYRKLSRGKSFYFWMKSLEVRYQWSCQKNIFFVYNMVIGYCCGGTMDGVSINDNNRKMRIWSLKKFLTRKHVCQGRSTPPEAFSCSPWRCPPCRWGASGTPRRGSSSRPPSPSIWSSGFLHCN